MRTFRTPAVQTNYHRNLATIGDETPSMRFFGERLETPPASEATPSRIFFGESLDAMS